MELIGNIDREFWVFEVFVGFLVVVVGGRFCRLVVVLGVVGVCVMLLLLCLFFFVE